MTTPRPASRVSYKLEAILTGTPGNEDLMERLVRETLEDNGFRLEGGPVVFRFYG